MERRPAAHAIGDLIVGRLDRVVGDLAVGIDHDRGPRAAAAGPQAAGGRPDPFAFDVAEAVAAEDGPHRLDLPVQFAGAGRRTAQGGRHARVAGGGQFVAMGGPVPGQRDQQRQPGLRRMEVPAFEQQLGRLLRPQVLQQRLIRDAVDAADQARQSAARPGLNLVLQRVRGLDRGGDPFPRLVARYVAEGLISLERRMPHPSARRSRRRQGHVQRGEAGEHGRQRLTVGQPDRVFVWTIGMQRSRCQAGGA